MLNYFFQRILALLLVMLVVSAAVFFLMDAVPGGPFSLGERGYTAEALANLNRKYGLDVPALERYGNYLAGVLRFDFGNSIAVAGSPPVIDVIARTWPVTLHVGLYTILVSFTVGFFFGLIAAYYRNSLIDNFVTLLSTLGAAVPNFIVATWLLLLCGYQVGWGVPNKWIIPPLAGTNGAILSADYFLPVITYALFPLGLVARYTRSSVVDALDADYIRTARAKGLGERLILFRHVLRNALIPIITVLLPQIPNLLTGSLFIEVAYGIPGLGKFFVTSIFNQDYPMIMALVLLIAFFWSLTYLVTDILYVAIDPRIRLGGAKGAT